MANEDEGIRAELARAGRCPPEANQDFWIAMKYVCRAFARRRRIPPEDLLLQIHMLLITTPDEKTNASKEAESEFKEPLRDLYKLVRRSLVADRLPHADHLDVDDLPLADLHLDHADLLALDAVLEPGTGHLVDDDARDELPPLPVGEVTDSAPHACPEEFTTEEAAEFLGVSRSYVIKLVKAGEIPARLVGRYRRIRVSELVKYRDKSFANAEAALDDLSQAVMAEIEDRGPIERRDDVPRM